MNPLMELALTDAKEGIQCGDGGPFGAVIADGEGQIIAVGHNRVLANHDPTAHAEIETIRAACRKLQTHDLTGFALYTTCAPCPMCLAAIIWSNISKVYYGCSAQDAREIGFRDELIADYLAGGQPELMNLNQVDRTECLELFREYQAMNGTLY